jgi:hypothetical protein
MQSSPWRHLRPYIEAHFDDRSLPEKVLHTTNNALNDLTIPFIDNSLGLNVMFEPPEVEWRKCVDGTWYTATAKEIAITLKGRHDVAYIGGKPFPSLFLLLLSC